ncbi:hypothetical protein M413DRAFT_19076 [Hebeloma cylindrosporum]|uniref:GST N-terminal domain-containing protein n=1 Tax=Hebeloma cylindrosporum TaxID=76867 RepID=A0A0C3C9Q3_HEBCY|nr:hypothetical protein M413DRAFT_19076 [Hebeloma cylindrosporum h7]
MSITFYDIPSTNPGRSWSANLFKTRYTLNLKGIPYKTEWVEFPDIEPLCKKLGIPPTGKNAVGGDHYSLPAIHDPSTGVSLSDSLLIAEYLERTYPDTPQVFPHNTIALQVAFVDAFRSNISAIWDFLTPAACAKFNPRSEEYFRRTRKEWLGKDMEDMAPKGDAAVAEWARFKNGLDKVDAWYSAKTGAVNGGPFLLGKTPSWGDIVVASYFVMMRIVWGEDSEQWKDISSWNGGRWAGIVGALKSFEIVI